MTNLLHKFWPGATDEDEIYELVFFAALLLDIHEDRRWVAETATKLRKAGFTTVEVCS